jgi:hypothetical protein
VLSDPSAHLSVEGKQPLLYRVGGRGARDVVRDGLQAAARLAVEHAESAPRQPGVDPQHPHRLTPSEHLFGG